MAKEFDFYFDIGSPATYLAWTQVPKLAEETGAKANYKPILLGGVFKATGNSSPITVPEKGRWLFKDLTRWAKRYGIEYVFYSYCLLLTVLSSFVGFKLLDSTMLFNYSNYIRVQRNMQKT